MSKVLAAVLLFVLSFSIISSSPTSTDRKDGDFDIFDIFLDLFGLGSSSEEYSFENQTLTSELEERFRDII